MGKLSNNTNAFWVKEVKKIIDNIDYNADSVISYKCKFSGVRIINEQAALRAVRLRYKPYNNMYMHNPSVLYEGHVRWELMNRLRRWKGRKE